nr:collagen triple helix repeat-containing protein 1-like [Pocillopora verrucosa]
MGSTTSPQKHNPQAGADQDPCEKSVFTHGFSRIPGSNGIPGMPGIPGAPGPQGQQGKDGAKGEPGVKGPRGMTGTRGQKGNPGSLGKNGAPGMMGIKGDKGHEGPRGSSGPPGIKGVKGEQGSKGEKGEIVNSAVSQTNWKQCVWKNGDSRYSGKIKDCSFNKLQSDTAIKVSFQGNMRVYGTSVKCNRWFFKFNGNECSGPMTIEAVVYNHWPSGSPNLHHHRSFEGYCENIPQGRVTVELWVGQCPGGRTLGDAHTGWLSVSRIMIEEVSRAQS